jgi:hypothetical protein
MWQANCLNLGGNTMHTQWLAQEHYRIHLIEEWPEGPRKEAGLAAAKAALLSLEQTAPKPGATFLCEICAARQDLRISEVVPLALAA